MHIIGVIESLQCRALVPIMLERDPFCLRFDENISVKSWQFFKFKKIGRRQVL